MDPETSENAGSPRTGRHLHFGPFSLDPLRRVLNEGAREVPLGSRAMDLLLLLVERAGGLVTGDELTARAWPDLAVAEVNLRVHISTLRSALGGAGVRAIVTVPGRGYRFILPVRDETTDPSKPIAPRDAIPPAPAAGAVGRRELIDRIVERVPQHRLITILGPGGIGKTTVASAAAAAFGSAFSDGTKWIDVGSLARGDSVAMAVAQAVGLANFTQDPTPGVIAWLRERKMLLVLDCCDRAVPATAAMVERILRETTGIHTLATSREALRAAGEHVVRLPPLATPPPNALTAAEACRFPAVQLFVERAAAVLGGFVLRDEDAPLVARICVRLDGIALAIELAAGHLVAFDLRRLAALLDDKFALLPAGRRTSVARHRTMRAALEWSYDVLPAEERKAFLGLAVFESGATSPAIAAVLGEHPGAIETVVAALARLTDKSLVNAGSGADGLTYSLLDTTRAFALERLIQSGVSDDTRRLHATHMLDTLRLLGRQGQEASSAEWFAARRHALADVRAALAWAFARPGEDALALACEAVGLFFGLSLADECRRRASEALERLGRADMPEKFVEMRLRAILAAASLYTPGPLPRLLDLWESVLALAVELGDAEHEAASLFGLLSASIHRDEPEQALAYTARFRTLACGVADETRDLVSDRMTAIAHHLSGRQMEARGLLQGVVVRYDAAVHGWNNSGFRVDHGLMAQVTLARVLWFCGEADKAIRLCRRCITALLAQDHAIALCYALFEVAIPLHCLVGDLDAASREVRRLQDCAEQHGLAIFQAGAAWAALTLAALRGEADDGACRVAADALVACGYVAQWAWLCALMAEASLRNRDGPAGLAWIAAPIASARDDTRCWLPELLRLRAELTALDHGDDARAAAEADLRRARALSIRHGAPALELRIAISQARLAGENGHAERRALAGVLDQFQEGFATADFETARTILAARD